MAAINSAAPGASGSTRGTMTPAAARARSSATAILLAAAAIIACALRMILGRSVAIRDDMIVFLDTDAWYHMRLVDGLIRTFPFRIWFDPFLIHPGHQTTQVGPLMDWLIAGTVLVLGGERASPAFVDFVGASVPAIVGSLTVIPVYFLAKDLCSRRAALFSATLIGLFPGDVLLRSLFGFTDHHCLETLLAATTLAALTRALNPDHTRRHKAFATACAGFALGAYLLTWSGGLLLVFILCAWGAGHLAFARLKRIGADEVFVVLSSVLVIGALIVLPWVDTTRSFAHQAAGLAAGFVMLPLVWGLGRLTSTRVSFAAAVLLCTACGMAVTLLAAPHTVTSLFRGLAELSPRRIQPVMEATPLFKTPDRFPLWRQFALGTVLALLPIPVLAWSAVRRADARLTLFMTWTAVILAATIGQVRFSYYLAISVAVLAGAGCDLLLRWIANYRPSRALAFMAGSLLIAGCLASAAPYYRQIANSGTATLPEHLDAFAWLRTNTPDPFDDPDVYFRALPSSEMAPTAAYGVMTPWPQGYALIRVARRVPNANGSQVGARDLASFLLAQNEADARRIVDRLDTRYVLTDATMVERLLDGTPAPSHFGSVALTIGRWPQQYREVFQQRGSDGRLRQRVVYYPNYYRTMIARLQSFGGGAVSQAPLTWVISFSVRTESGAVVKEIDSERMFASYEEAVSFVDAAHSDRVRIVGFDPFVSCVPLAKLDNYVEVYHSLSRFSTAAGSQPALRIFEYRGWQPRAADR